MGSKDSNRNSYLMNWEDVAHRKWKRNREFRRAVLRSDMRDIRRDSRR